ncbi:MAG: HyaD/HybD family hydrogenase maturation endopeptidase [Trichlorobacter sp.]|nr:HyaD/HybD family hydrogenase maturation endopeptidase [Trichlorobacter sp.]
MKTLVLGLGNTIMTDDGVGPKVIEILQTGNYELPDGAELLDGGTLGLDLLPYLEGVERLIIVDAVETGEVPGTLIRLEGEDVPIALATRLSAHQMGLKDLLAVAELMGCLPQHVVLIGIQPACLEMGTELTAALSSKLPELVNMVREEFCRLTVSQ